MAGSFAYKAAQLVGKNASANPGFDASFDLQAALTSMYGRLQRPLMGASLLQSMLPNKRLWETALTQLVSCMHEALIPLTKSARDQRGASALRLAGRNRAARKCVASGLLPAAVAADALRSTDPWAVSCVAEVLEERHSEAGLRSIVRKAVGRMAAARTPDAADAVKACLAYVLLTAPHVHLFVPHPTTTSFPGTSDGVMDGRAHMHAYSTPALRLAAASIADAAAAVHALGAKQEEELRTKGFIVGAEVSGASATSLSKGGASPKGGVRSIGSKDSSGRQQSSRS